MTTTESPDNSPGPHQKQPVKHAGAPLRVADAALVLLHGRGATAESILDLADELGVHGVAAAAPQAQYNRWYPQSFLAPLETNEPELSSALHAVDDVVGELVERGVPPDRIVIGGFSQGACLAAEYVARNPRQYGGLVVLRGGLVGPGETEFDHTGDLAGTPVFLDCSDVDPHVPPERVHESRDLFERLGGDVTERVYEGMAHTVNDDEIAFLRDLLQALVERKTTPSDSGPDGGDGQ
jgi:phospholipase/carboxylesterase